MLSTLRSIILLTIITVVSSQEDDRSRVDDLKLLESSLHTVSEYMKNETKYEDVAVFLGTTKSGKSSLINYLIGGKLVAERNNPGLGLWDAADFSENRGPVQDITNAYFLKILLQKVKSLRIVLVIDFNDILIDNLKQFSSLLTVVDNLFGGRKTDYFGCISVIFTKVPEVVDDETVSLGIVVDKIRSQLSSKGTKIPGNSTELIQYFIDHNQNIGLFLEPRIGEITPTIDSNLLQIIQQAKPIEEDDLRKVSPSISESTKDFLNRNREELFSEEAFQELVDSVDRIYRRRLDAMVAKSGESKDTLKAFKASLSTPQAKIDENLDPKIGFQKRLTVFESIDPEIGILVKNHNLLGKFNLMVIVDELLSTAMSKQFDERLKSALQSVSTVLKKLNGTVNTKLELITAAEAKIQFEQEKEHHEHGVPKLGTQIEEYQKHDEERVRKEGSSTSVVKWVDEAFHNVKNKVTGIFGDVRSTIVGIFSWISSKI